MKYSYSKALRQAIGLGAIAGLRAAVAPALASHYLSKHPNKALLSSKLKFIQSPVTAVVTKMLSAVEFAGDKLPTTGNRIALPQVVARVASGALVGATVFQANKQGLVKGAIIGGSSALVATFASFYARQYLDKIPHVKDAFVGVFEDTVAVSSGVKLLS